MTDLSSLSELIASARARYTKLLATSFESRELTKDQYHRYLSMQYHLTKGVQWYFYTAAAHESLRRRRKLRRFLVEFANEEELHYLVAANDLHTMGLPVLAEPFDVELWHAYMTREVQARPFIRLGAAAVLENLASPDNHALLKRILSAPFLNRDNTKFLTLHMHESVPHGQEIMDTLGAEALEASHVADLEEGARKGTVLYLRMAEWALDTEALSAFVPGALSRQSDEEAQRIRSFTMDELVADSAAPAR
jgi:hypothetical protein